MWLMIWLSQPVCRFFSPLLNSRHPVDVCFFKNCFTFASPSAGNQLIIFLSKGSEPSIPPVQPSAAYIPFKICQVLLFLIVFLYLFLMSSNIDPWSNNLFLMVLMTVCLCSSPSTVEHGDMITFSSPTKPLVVRYHSAASISPAGHSSALQCVSQTHYHITVTPTNIWFLSTSSGCTWPFFISNR